MTTQPYRVPWAQYEQIDIPTTQLKSTTASRWRNSTDHPIEIEKILLDSNSVTTVSVRWGKRGELRLIDKFVNSRAVHNCPLVANQATDGAWPLWKFAEPARIPKRQSISVTLGDLVTGADRVANVQLICFKRDGNGLYIPRIPTDRVTIPDGGVVTAILDTDEVDDLFATALAIYLEETGTAAKLRGLSVRVQGGAMPDWMSQAILGSVLFPDSNPAAAIYRPPEKLVLAPGEVFEAEFYDSSGTAHTVYLGAVGARLDTRSA